MRVVIPQLGWQNGNVWTQKCAKNSVDGGPPMTPKTHLLAIVRIAESDRCHCLAWESSTPGRCDEPLALHKIALFQPIALSME